MDDEISISSDLPVLVIGAAGMDMVGRLKSSLRPHTSNPAQIRYAFGGAARNVAENLLHLGTSVTLLTVLGRDEPGDNLIQAIGGAGANVDRILRSTEYPTGTYLAVVNTDGKLEYGLDDMRILAELSPKYIRAQEDLFSQASLVFFDANLPKETIRTIMSVAGRAKLPACADPTSEALAPKLIPHLPRLRLVVPNRNEAAILCKRGSEIKTQQRCDGCSQMPGEPGSGDRYCGHGRIRRLLRDIGDERICIHRAYQYHRSYRCG